MPPPLLECTLVLRVLLALSDPAITLASLFATRDLTEFSAMRSGHKVGEARDHECGSRQPGFFGICPVPS